MNRKFANLQSTRPNVALNEGSSNALPSSYNSPRRVSDLVSDFEKKSDQYPGDGNKYNDSESNSAEPLHEEQRNSDPRRKMPLPASPRDRTRLSTLPTLEETSICSGSDQSTDSRHDELTEPRSLGEDRDLTRKSPVPPTIEDAMVNKAQSRLKAIASNLALRGKEQDSLENYRVTLKMSRIDLQKVKRALEGTLDTDQRLKAHNEWITFAAFTADIHTSMAILEDRTGDRTEAVRSCREARTIYKKLGKFEARFKANEEQMDKMVSQLKKSGETYEQRKELHESAIRLRNEVKAVSADQRPQVIQELFETLEGALRLERMSLGAAHPQVADTIGLLGTLYFETKDIDKAIGYFKKALSILRLALGPYHPKSALAFKQLAGLHEKRKQHDDLHIALDLYIQAIQAFRESYGDHDPQVGSTMNTVALIYIRQKQLERAVDTLNDALTVYEDATVTDKESIHPDTAQIWKNLGHAHVLREEWDSAALAFSSSLDVQRIVKKRKQASGWQSVFMADQGFADTLRKLGKAKMEVNKPAESLEHFEEALQLHKAAVKFMTARHAQNNDKNGMLVAQEHLASTMLLKGTAQEACGKLKEAHEMYVTTLMMMRQNGALRGEMSSGANEGCAGSLAGIGSIHLKNGEFKDARDVFKEALSVYQACNGSLKDPTAVEKVKQRLDEAIVGIQSSPPSQLKRISSPRNKTEHGKAKTGNNQDRAQDFENKAREYADNGEYDNSIRILTEVVVIRRQRLTRAQQKANGNVRDGMKEKDDVARTLCVFAEVLTKKEDYEQAIVLFEESFRMYRSNGVHPPDERARSILETLDRLYAFADS